MGERRIVDVFNIRSRFLRSVQLERDFQDSAALSGYVKTDFVQECCERISDGLRPKSGRRAWRVTGDYGSGKSSFALLVANVLAGRDSRQAPQIVRAFDFKKLGVAQPVYLPVLVTCSRKPLATSILTALHNAIASVYKRGANSKPAEAIERLLKAKTEPSDEQIVEAILDANSQVIADGKGNGLLILVDELGKFLEFAALSPHRQDVFLLQKLAEAASRSGNEPLFLVCLLHQGFNAYADQLNQSAQREWEKGCGALRGNCFQSAGRTSRTSHRLSPQRGGRPHTEGATSGVASCDATRRRTRMVRRGTTTASR